MKTTNYLLHSIFVFALVFINLGCTKNEFDNPEPELSVVSEEVTGVAPKVMGNITAVNYPIDYAEEQEAFDWESLEYLPLPAGVQRVPMPWSDKAKRQFSDDIRDDYKRADGWELYMSTSSSKFWSGHLTLSLYNKYRGILRYYYFVGTGTQKVQNYNILQSSGYTHEDSPLLNFTNQFIVDVDRNPMSSFSFEPQPLADSSWLAVEYELAFDKNIYSKNSMFQMAFNLSMVKNNALSLNGQPSDELKTKVRAYGLSETPAGSTISADAAYVLYGQSDLDQLASTLSGTDLDHLINLNEENILDGLRYKASWVHTKWNTTLNMQLAPSGVGITNNSLPVSGSDLSSIQGLAPFYPKALGVFYLNRKPVYAETTSTDADHPYQYKLDVSSVEYLFNPAVLETAEIKNLHQELVATEQESLIEDNKRANLFRGQILKSNKPLHIQGVRVSFDLVPKDGADTVHFIKTFKAAPES